MHDPLIWGFGGKQKGIFFALNEPVEKVLGNTECNIPLMTFI